MTVDISDEAVRRGVARIVRAELGEGPADMLLALRAKLTEAEAARNNFEWQVRMLETSATSLGKAWKEGCAFRDAMIAELRKALVGARDEHNYTITWIGAGAPPHQHTAMMDRCDRTIARIDAALKSSEPK